MPENDNNHTVNLIVKVDPIELKLADGKTRQLKYTNRQLKEVARHFGGMKKLFDADMTESIGMLVFCGLVDRTEFTSADDIDDLIEPKELGNLYAAVVAAIIGETAENVKNVLRRGSLLALGLPAEEIMRSTGYVNGQSLDTSDSPVTTTGASPEPKPLPS